MEGEQLAKYTFLAPASRAMLQISRLCERGVSDGLSQA